MRIQTTDLASGIDVHGGPPGWRSRLLAVLIKKAMIRGDFYGHCRVGAFYLDFGVVFRSVIVLPVFGIRCGCIEFGWGSHK